jgi:hypothetical protein
MAEPPIKGVLAGANYAEFLLTNIRQELEYLKNTLVLLVERKDEYLKQLEAAKLKLQRFDGLLSAKYLDPECMDGCQSLSWKLRASILEQTLEYAREAAAANDFERVRQVLQTKTEEVTK